LIKYIEYNRLKNIEFVSQLFFFIYIYNRIGLLTNLSFLSFLLFFSFPTFSYFFLWPSRCCLLSSSQTFFLYVVLVADVILNECARFTIDDEAVGLRWRIEQNEREKREKQTKTHRPMIPLHIHISLFNVIVSFFLLSPSPCYRLVET
jgi:hypothetical protein